MARRRAAARIHGGRRPAQRNSARLTAGAVAQRAAAAGWLVCPGSRSRDLGIPKGAWGAIGTKAATSFWRVGPVSPAERRSTCIGPPAWKLLFDKSGRSWCRPFSKLRPAPNGPTTYNSPLVAHAHCRVSLASGGQLRAYAALRLTTAFAPRRGSICKTIRPIPTTMAASAMLKVGHCFC